MKITFVLPYSTISGGVKVVTIYAKTLGEHGHEVKIISSKRKRLKLKGKLLYLIKNKKWPSESSKRETAHFDNNNYSWNEVTHPGPIVDSDIPDADIVIATWWETAIWVNKLAPSKGKKVYFCQHYEVHDYLPKKNVEATYFYPMLQICVSLWVKSQIEHLTGKDNQVVVMNGVDTNQFFGPVRSKNMVPTFGFLYHPTKWKGTDIILEALKLAKKRKSNIKVVCFGLEYPEDLDSFPDWITFYKRPDQNFIRKLYSMCDAWLFGSRTEGFGLPILEAMACRTPVIATPAGAALNLVSKSCGFLIPHEDSNAMAEKIVAISEATSMNWSRLSESAYQVAQRNKWSDAAIKFENILIDKQ